MTAGVAVVFCVNITDVERELLVEYFPVLGVDIVVIVKPNVLFAIEMLLVD